MDPTVAVVIYPVAVPFISMIPVGTKGEPWRQELRRGRCETRPKARLDALFLSSALKAPQLEKKEQNFTLVQTKQESKTTLKPADALPPSTGSHKQLAGCLPCKQSFGASERV